jgi:hypothetical protein
MCRRLQRPPKRQPHVAEPVALAAAGAVRTFG